MKDFDLPSLIELIVDGKLDQIHAGLPAKIVKYDAVSQKATVQPIIKYKDRSAGKDAKGLQDMPLIQNIPVIHPSAGKAMISFPVQVGDIVALMFCSKDIDNFTMGDGSGTQEPSSTTSHSYNDCYAILGLYPFSKAIGSHTSDLVVKMNCGTANECSIALQPSGDVVVTTPAKVIVNAGGNVEVNASGDMTATIGGDTTIDCGQTTITGQLRVDGKISSGADVETDAGFKANSHKHIGNLSKPTSAFIP